MKRSPLKRRARLRAMSDKRRKASRIYSRRRQLFLDAHSVCQLCHGAASRDIHHREGRAGARYLDETTWLALCRECHDAIHQSPNAARKSGLLA